MRSQQATLGQIAQKLGVSITTVSRILSDKKLHSFSKETIDLVRSTAQKLHYRPNRLVRGIQTGYSGLIGVMMPVFSDYYGIVFEGIHDALVKRDRAPIALWTRHDSANGVGKTELEQIHTLVDLRVDGIILKPIFDAASDLYLHEIFQRKIPLVVVDRELPRVRTNFIGTDDQAGIHALIQYLVELGHDSIAYFGPDTEVSTGLLRQQAFHSSLANYPKVKRSNHLTKSWEPQWEEAIALLRSPDQPTAVVAVNDNFAYTVYQAAAQENIRIPEDLSVTGFGNLPTYTFLNPRLTTLDQHPYDVGLSAVDLLLSRLENLAPIDRFQKVLIPPDLVIRQSTGAPKKSRSPV